MNVAVSFLLFTTLFPSPMPGSVLRRSLLLYLPAMCVVGGVLYFHLHALVSGSLAAYGVGRSLYDLFHILILVYVGLGILNFIRSFRRTTDPVERKKLQWILWGLAIGPGPFLLLVTLVELFVPLSPVPEEYTLVFFVLIPITFAISLIRYHLLDIEIVISRTTVYAMVFGIVVGVYLCAVAIAAFVVGSASPPAYAAGAVLVALLFEPARVRVQRFVDRRFFRVRYDFRLAERRFLERIEHCVDVQQLADLLVGDTDALIPLRRIGFFRVEEPGHRLRCMAHRGFDMLERRGVTLEPERLKTQLENPVGLTERMEPGITHEPADPGVFHRWGMVVVFPMVAEGPTLLGFLVLGEKKSGARFTSEDVDLMRNVAAQAGLEIQRIMLQQQLMEKQAEARHLAELNQLKSDFVSYVSHEFRTPLTSIRMYAELLGTIAGRVGAKGQEFLHVIEGETERLDRMVTTVLDSAKIERGVKHYRFEKCDLRSIADNVLAMMSYQLKKHRFRVDYRPGRGPAPFIADADAVGQAIMNLISNSIKYSGGRRKITLVLTRNARWVSCAVTDCGEGVSRDALPHLFEKFYRDPARSSGVQGVGLGLPLVKHIMDAHGGAVLVKSTPGKGSTFTLRFPVRGPIHGTNNKHPGGGG
jgi:signal transduction histidine kinase